ncbi:hypothetical protein Tco_0374862 [Tanacetum coccineum]
MADLVSKVVDEIVMDTVDWAIQAPLRDRFRDFPEIDMKEILHHRMWETNSYKAHEDHKKLYEALEKSMDRDHSDQLLTDLAEARRKKKKRHDSPKTPPGSPPHQLPPPPPPASPSRTLGAFGTSGSYNVSKPLPLGGQPGQVIIQADFFFNKDLEYLRYGSKGGKLALSISKMKAACYPDVGLEQMVPDQMWIEEECKYDIAAMYDATGFEYKHDFTIIKSPRAVTFWDKYGVQMIMEFNELHKFSDGTLQQIDEPLDYRVKEFKVNRINPGLNTQFWTRKDVDRSKEFMFAIQK